MKLNCPVISVASNVPAVLQHKCQQVEQTPESDVCMYTSEMVKKTFLSQVLLSASATIRAETFHK